MVETLKYELPLTVFGHSGKSIDKQRRFFLVVDKKEG